ncbi:hypothetical protein [Chitinophaga rhizophila]|uniref:Curli production assembly/transport component CsgG n=1 Tax=Chitinophaga rhizophila TaxID=2866212 RepID=A0ABS7GK00_9BACT|nr:hypothetical protein [Chitinophaga rhizophila]MBW8688046.1 hypothetical protein [Chitinophaga rhizophila]
MTKRVLSVLCGIVAFSSAFAQTKNLVGVASFKSSGRTEYVTAIQNTVYDATLKVRGFSLMEKDKLEQIKAGVGQPNPDAGALAHAKSLGAQYIVTGNILKANVDTKPSDLPLGITNVTTSELLFDIAIVDVNSGEEVATSRFTAGAKGKRAFEDAMKELTPGIEKFIRENLKTPVSIAQIEEKNSAGEAIRVLIVAGSLSGLQEHDEFRVYEVTDLTVDGKKMHRKKTLGKIAVAKIEDENFSICLVKEGGAAIAKKVEAGAKIKCEIVTE